MKINKTKIKGLLVIKGVRHTDKRGYLRELLLEKKINKKFKFHIASFSKKNVLRGLHFCKSKPQSQLVTVLKGKILDVVVDVRINSNTFGEWNSFELSDESISQIYMDKGFAHGFYVISDYVDMHYKVSELYNPKDDHGIIWDDKELSIKWPNSNPIISEKDKNFPAFKDIKFI